MSISIKDKMLAVLCAFLYGITFVFLKMGVTEFSPELLCCIRYLLAAGILLPFCKKPDKADIKYIVLFALITIFGDLLLSLHAMKYLDAGISGVVIQTNIIFAIFLARIIYKETFGLYRWAGVFISFCGIFILAGEPTITASWPLIMTVASGFFIACNLFLIKSIKNTDMITVNGWNNLLIGLIFSVIVLLFKHDAVEQIQAATWKGWVGIIGAATIASCIAFTLWIYLISKNDISKLAPYGLLTPVFSFFDGVFLLGETITIHKAVGCLLIVCGVGIIEMRQYMLAKKKEMAVVVEAL